LLQKIPEAVVLDIGANIGNHSVAIASYVKQLYCFEVQPQLIALLAENLRLNKIEHAHIFYFGLSNSDKTLPVYIDKMGNLGRSTLEYSLHSPDFLEEMVELKQGDAVLAENNVKKVDLIKIDIEGHEIMALLGLQKTIQQHRPIITMEWNNDVTFLRGLRRSLIKATMSKMSKTWEPLLFDFKFNAKYETLIICPEEKQYLLEGLPWKT
jgi:FkbM family methyltransferase